jgi:hypothetical protein
LQICYILIVYWLSSWFPSAIKIHFQHSTFPSFLCLWI